MLETLSGWWKTLMSYLTPDPPAMKESDMALTIQSILLANTKDFGPSPRTGGQLHRITRAVALEEAQLIAQYAPLSRLDPLLVVAGIIGESRGDPFAVNPNRQDAKPGESTHEAFLHYDIGVCQFDVAGFIHQEAFVDMTDAQIQAKMCDLQWAIPEYCRFIAGLVQRSADAIKANPNLLGFIPHRDQSLLAEEAYNKGLHGAEEEALAHGPFAYAEAWEARYLSYKKLVS